MDLDVVIPVYNEHLETLKSTVAGVLAACGSVAGLNYHVFVVDDGSSPPVPPEVFKNDSRVSLIRLDRNSGYGEALKRGIRSGRASRIAILDADGTYPVEQLPRLLEPAVSADMVVGVRTGKINETPFARRLPKRLLNLFATYLAGTPIVDLNSGMRIFTRELVNAVWCLLPRGFSFTSTLTMGAIAGRYHTVEIPIDYYQRSGESSVRPIRDTLRFFKIVGRLGLLFAPLRVFLPIAVLLFSVGFIKGIARDFIIEGRIGNASLLLMLSGVQIFMMGLIGDLVVRSRQFRPYQESDGHRV